MITLSSGTKQLGATSGGNKSQHQGAHHEGIVLMLDELALPFVQYLARGWVQFAVSGYSYLQGTPDFKF